MNVSAIIVTRGDVDLVAIAESIPESWEVVVWDNGSRMVTRSDGWAEVCTDLAVYGRYAAIEHASHDLIYVQDDDVIVSDPQEIVDTQERTWMVDGSPTLVCNMPQEFRHEFYTEHALVGFGACFHRDAPERAFERFRKRKRAIGAYNHVETPVFNRTCDIVFTGLTKRILVDVPRVNLSVAYDANRMWKQPTHTTERQRMLDIVRSVP